MHIHRKLTEYKAATALNQELSAYLNIFPELHQGAHRAMALKNAALAESLQKKLNAYLKGDELIKNNQIILKTNTQAAKLFKSLYNIYADSQEKISNMEEKQEILEEKHEAIEEKQPVEIENIIAKSQKRTRTIASLMSKDKDKPTVSWPDDDDKHSGKLVDEVIIPTEENIANLLQDKLTGLASRGLIVFSADKDHEYEISSNISNPQHQRKSRDNLSYVNSIINFCTRIDNNEEAQKLLATCNVIVEKIKQNNLLAKKEVIDSLKLMNIITVKNGNIVFKNDLNYCDIIILEDELPKLKEINHRGYHDEEVALIIKYCETQIARHQQNDGLEI